MEKITLHTIQFYIESVEDEKEIILNEFDNFIIIKQKEISNLNKCDRQEKLLLIDILKDVNKDNIRNFHPERILYDLSDLTNFNIDFTNEDLILIYTNQYKERIRSLKQFYKLKKQIEDIEVKKQMLQKVS